jgi:hypothetical protein
LPIREKTLAHTSAQTDTQIQSAGENGATRSGLNIFS